MRFVDEFRDAEKAQALAAQITALCERGRQYKLVLTTPPHAGTGPCREPWPRGCSATAAVTRRCRASAGALLEAARSRTRVYLTSTFTRIQGWMQH